MTAHPPPQQPGVAHSQPSSAVGAVGFEQLEKPAEHAELHVPPLHEGEPETCVAEQARPHPPHFVAEEVTSVSQPSLSGAVVVQSAKPALQPEYVHVTPVLHAAPVLFVVSHVTPHAEQFVVVLSAVSQPLVSGDVVTQSPKPGLQLAYVQVVPDVHAGVLLLVVSHTRPHAPQLVADVVVDSQPFALLPVMSQSRNPALHPV